MSQLVFLANAGGNITFNGTNTANAYSVTVPAANGTLAYIDGSNNLNTTNLVATGTGSFGGTLSVTGVTSLSTLNTTGDAIFGGTGEIQIPSGTTAQRSSSPAQGMIRYNVTNSNFEGYNGSAWGSIAVPAGSNTQIQYNNSGSLGASSALTFNGTALATTTLQSTNLSDGTNSTSTTNAIQGSAKAWVRFNPSSGAGTIVKSYNVSSVTYSATGYYVVNFTNALSDANYCVTGAASPDSGTYQCFATLFAVSGSTYQAPTTSSFAVEIQRYNGAQTNPYAVCLTVYD